MKWLLMLLLLVTWSAQAQERIVVGSKTFTESYLLAEIFAQLLESGGFNVVRQFGFGGTLVCYEALVNGEIDVYPEYTGTISETILKLDTTDTSVLDARLTALSLQLLKPLGFNNTYAIATGRETAARLGLKKISDLSAHRNLVLGFSHEFRDRPDGWPGLAAAYDLDIETQGIDHGLAYRALADGKIDITDAYSTDGDIERHGLVLLDDDREFFPRYEAVPLARSTLPPAAAARIEQLAGKLDDVQMRQLNGEVMVAGREVAAVAQDFLIDSGLLSDRKLLSADSVPRRLQRNLVRHLQLILTAVILACLIGVPAGILVHRSRFAASSVLYLAGLLQTIPSIALLALMIPLFGVGVVPAIVALFLYSLLPILRNTITALNNIDPVLRRVAAGMGLTPAQQVRHVILPLAMPNVLAGIRTAAIISIGTATLAAFIGAGGLGEPIVTGLALNDTGLILQGAIPAALLALATELLFELIERRLIPVPLRTAQ